MQVEQKIYKIGEANALPAFLKNRELDNYPGGYLIGYGSGGKFLVTG